ncbi:MAG TPA: DUF4920 domain-containing protein [Vicinamibacterales bacterium]|nr:DUF4920 domain-containing protein [Vicinamibacterales bacterium]
MKALLCAAVLALATIGLSAEDKKLGTGVTLTEATPLKVLIEKPADYVGKTIRVDGVATAVCEHKGCWLALASDDTKGAATVRLKVEDDVIVFPITAKGKKVSAEGIFEAIDAKDEHGKDAAGEHAKHDGKASKTYQIKATGAVIK